MCPFVTGQCERAPGGCLGLTGQTCRGHICWQLRWFQSGGCPLVAEATCTSACHTSLEATVGESKRWCKKPPFSACQWPWRSRLHGVTIRRCHCRVRLPCIGGRPIRPSWTWVQWPWSFLLTMQPNSPATFKPAKLLQRTSIPWWVVTWRFWLLLLRGLLTLWRYPSHTWRISWRITKTKLWTILNPPGEMWLVSGSGQIELCGKVGFLMKVKLGEAGLESVLFCLKRFQPAKNLGKIFPSWLGNSISSVFFSWLRNAFLASGSTIPCWRSTPMIGIRPMPLCARRDKFEREACVGLVCVFWFLLFELLWILVVSYPILSYPILSINLSINH